MPQFGGAVPVVLRPVRNPHAATPHARSTAARPAVRSLALQVPLQTMGPIVTL